MIGLCASTSVSVAAFWDARSSGPHFASTTDCLTPRVRGMTWGIVLGLEGASAMRSSIPLDVRREVLAVSEGSSVASSAVRRPERFVSCDCRVISEGAASSRDGRPRLGFLNCCCFSASTWPPSRTESRDLLLGPRVERWRASPFSSAVVAAAGRPGCFLFFRPAAVTGALSPKEGLPTLFLGCWDLAPFSPSRLFRGRPRCFGRGFSSRPASFPASCGCDASMGREARFRFGEEDLRAWRGQLRV